VDSTKIATSLDPEEWYEVAAAYQKAAAAPVTRLGGHVAKYLGDGLVAYFGYPEAHGDDPERAVRAGLAILASIDSLNRELAGLHGLKLATRVGIHTGSVVMGESGAREADVFGDVPNVAARVQGAADPDSVLITSAVHRLVSGLFVLEERGAQVLKGVPEPVRLYRVVEESGARGRLHAAAAAGALTLLVGREEELRLLLDRWRLARSGQGQVVLIVGEPGIGKSRLIRELRGRIAGQQHAWLESAAPPFARNTPYYPVAELLRQGLAEHGDGSVEALLTRLEHAMELARLSAREALPLIAQIVNLPQQKHPMPVLAPDEQRRRTLSALAALILAMAREQPMVAVLEDFHWADPSTLELTQILAERGAEVPLLLIPTVRPEHRLPWPLRRHHTELRLTRLNDRQTREIVARLAAQATLPGEVVDTVVERTAGVPLFVEELTRLVLESADPSAVQEIPATLKDSLLARLDRLGSAREVAKVAAVIGREFSYDLIKMVAGLSEAELHSALDRLTNTELVYEQGERPVSTYTFKHALVQDTAYEALLRNQRRDLHRRIADAIEQLHAASLDEHVGELAYHLWQAGPAADVPKTVRYLGRAAERARQGGAYEEALRSLENALAAVRRLPKDPERVRQELDVALALSAVQTAARGYAAGEREKLLAEMLDLCEGVEDPLLLFMVRMQLWAFCSVRGKHSEEARGLSEQLCEMAAGIGHPTLLMWTHIVSGNTSYHMGDFVSARSQLEKGIALCNSETRSVTGSFQDPGALALGYLALVLWTLGYPEQAVASGEASISVARELQDFMALAHALHFSSALRLYRGEPELTLRLAEETISVSATHGMTIWVGQGTMWTGAALIELDRVDEGLQRLMEGVSLYTSTGAQLGITYRMGFLAKAHIRAGNLDLALRLLDGIAEVETMGGEGIELAELHRARPAHVDGILRDRFQNHPRLLRGMAEGVGLPISDLARCFYASTADYARASCAGWRRWLVAELELRDAEAAGNARRALPRVHARHRSSHRCMAQGAFAPTHPLS
jgi:class 3 adenylate cyclase/tetratricopeptide (TPR) repeat protein